MIRFDLICLARARTRRALSLLPHPPDRANPLSLRRCRPAELNRIPSPAGSSAADAPLPAAAAAALLSPPSLYLFLVPKDAPALNVP